MQRRRLAITKIAIAELEWGMTLIGNEGDVVMMEKSKHAKEQALLARERALQCGNESMRNEWLKVAELWDAISHEYGLLAKGIGTKEGPTAA